MFFRGRRLRKNTQIRELVKETELSINDLVYPIFVTYDKNAKQPIDSMPGCFRYGIERLAEILDKISSLGILAVILFGIPEKKDETGSAALDDQGVVQQAIRKIKSEYPNIFVIADVCLCEYTSHGHCGVLFNGDIDNDATIKTLSNISVSYALAGADMIAPSDMMDGRILAIRQALDNTKMVNTSILSYSAKYSSAFYGPFRDAAGSSPAFGDRKAYQMDFHNIRNAMMEIQHDIEEGADIVMVKPALAYLDIIRAARDRFNIPIAAYNVSGEYSMIKAASEKGWLDEQNIVLEILTGIKRAGADIILTYFALDVAKWLRQY